ncbi:MAG: DUF99 family protein, partial [Betaproteobacteria bacterium]
MTAKLTHVIGFDDAPFGHAHRGDVAVVGIVYANHRPEGVLLTKVRRDGANATAKLARAVLGSRHCPHLRLIMLQGIALAGFNVVDINELFARTKLPVLVVSRVKPDPQSVRRALLSRIRGGKRKWRLVERAGASDPVAGLWVQRAGISADAA